MLPSARLTSGHKLYWHISWHCYDLFTLPTRPRQDLKTVLSVSAVWTQLQTKCTLLICCCLLLCEARILCIHNSDVTKFAFKFDVRTSNVFSRFEIHQIFSHMLRRIRTSGLHNWHHMSTPTGHQNNQLNKCALPNSLKGPKIILDMADRCVSKDGPFRILGNALTYLLSDFFGITFLHFLSETC